MIDEKLARRFVGGEEMKGDEATAVLLELTTFGGWRMWIRTALAHLEADHPEEAARTLREILADQTLK